MKVRSEKISQNTSEKIGKLKFHRICRLFPLMQKEELESLKADIQENNLHEPILLHPDGSILDGRNRYLACRSVGVKPKYKIWNNRGSQLALVVSNNMQRRHLTSSQKATLAVELLPMLEKEAAQRKGGRPSRSRKHPQKIAEVFGEAREQAARISGTNRQYVSDAKRIKIGSPKVFKCVKDGTLTLKEAKQLIQFEKPLQMLVIERIVKGKVSNFKTACRQIKDENGGRHFAKEAIAGGGCKIIEGDACNLDLTKFERYSVIIADPPWPYDNPKSHDPRMGGYTYPSMTVEEICAIPVQGLAADNCILFLWGTWPKLPQVVQVMKVWGFEHVTGFPWVKTTKDLNPVYGVGYWVAGCSEYVLIGRRGKVSPPNTDNYLGLVGPAFEHSRKPDDVHDIAENLSGPYLELFAHRTRAGWTVFGNSKS